MTYELDSNVVQEFNVYRLVALVQLENFYQVITLILHQHFHPVSAFESGDQVCVSLEMLQLVQNRAFIQKLLFITVLVDLQHHFMLLMVSDDENLWVIALVYLGDNVQPWVEKMILIGV